MVSDNSLDSDSPPKKIQRLDTAPIIDIKFISLDREFSTEVSTITFTVIKGVQNKNINKLLKELPDLTAAYRHLKRVNEDKHVLVGPSNGELQEIRQKFAQSYGDSIEVYEREVSSVTSELRIHFEKANKLWPVKFVENIENEKLYWNRSVSDADAKKYYNMFMTFNDDKKTCIIYDPKVDKVLIQTTDDPSVPLAHAVMKAAKALAELEEPERYYASDCDVILSHEPCVMCAMALNHMRASRVFFRHDDLQRGAFTRIKLHRTWTSCYRYNVLRIDC